MCVNCVGACVVAFIKASPFFSAVITTDGKARYHKQVLLFSVEYLCSVYVLCHSVFLITSLFNHEYQSRLILNCSAVFHTEGGVPWDFPSLTWISPLKLTGSTVYFVLVSHPNSTRSSIYLSVILYETLQCMGYCMPGDFASCMHLVPR